MGGRGARRGRGGQQGKRVGRLEGLDPRPNPAVGGGVRYVRGSGKGPARATRTCVKVPKEEEGETLHVAGEEIVEGVKHGALCRATVREDVR